MKRILHLAWEYPPLVYGGLGRHIAALSAAQAEAGHVVTVVTQGEGPDLINGVQVVRVPSEPFPYSLPELHTWVGDLDHRMGAAACALQADVVHAHDWMVGRAGQRAATALGVPLVATIHATEAGRHSGWLPDRVSAGVHLVEQWLVDEADAVIVCSTSMADELGRGHGRWDAVVIPNGIDADAYHRVEPPAALMTGSPRLCFVGRIEWEKGVFTAVDAVAEVVAVHPSTHLRMVGTGGQMQALQERIDALGLTDHVELLGHVDEATLRSVYSSADLLLAPSSYEPFGIVALEAAAMGAPMIVGDTGGLAEFVTEERGRRARPNDPADLAEQILAALADPRDTAARARTAHRALAEYTWQRIADRTGQVYATTSARTPPARRLRVTDRQVWIQGR